MLLPTREPREPSRASRAVHETPRKYLNDRAFSAEARKTREDMPKKRRATARKGETLREKPMLSAPEVSHGGETGETLPAVAERLSFLRKGPSASAPPVAGAAPAPASHGRPRAARPASGTAAPPSASWGPGGRRSRRCRSPVA